MEERLSGDPSRYDGNSAVPQRLCPPLIEPIITYVRTLRFTGPEQVKRYFRLFGDLEYDVLSLRAEASGLTLKLREVRRRIEQGLTLLPEDEQAIGRSSRELVEHLYQKAERLRTAMTGARNFRFDPKREEQSYYLLTDITTALMGVEDPAIRRREREPLNIACEAYGRLDLNALLDLHDNVQQFLGLQRRDRLDIDEEQEWRQKLEDLGRTHPLCCAGCLEDPRSIARKMTALKQRIAREQQRVEYLALVYAAAVKAARFVS